MTNKTTYELPNFRLNQMLKFLAAVMFLTATSVASLPGTACALQATASNNAQDELDVWRGCSMGVRLKPVDGKSEVSELHDYAKGKTDLKEGDQLVAVEGVEISPLKLDNLTELLQRQSPDTKLSVKVMRDGEVKTIEATAFRKEYVDVPRISDMLGRNRIVKQRLEETDRVDFMEDFQQRLTDAVRESKSPRQAYEKMNRIIDEIDVSHTAFLPGVTYQQLLSGTGADPGITLQRHNVGDRDRYFVVDRKPGTVVHLSNIRLGDEVVRINGVPIEKSKRLILAGEEDRHNLFAIEAETNVNIAIDHQISPFDDLLTTTLNPQEGISTEESFSKSVTTLEFGDKKIGYARFWNLMSMDVATRFGKLLEENFAECDAIIMDLRGRGGRVQVVLRIDRLVRECGKPVIAITDGLTRSAKEMLSYRIKKHDNVTVIGTTTTGAVTGATFSSLPSGNALMYPALAADGLKRYLDGNVLEGVGVDPDEEVEFFIPYCGGKDLLIETAIRRAAQEATKVR